MMQFNLLDVFKNALLVFKKYYIAMIVFVLIHIMMTLMDYYYMDKLQINYSIRNDETLLKFLEVIKLTDPLMTSFYVGTLVMSVILIVYLATLVRNETYKLKQSFKERLIDMIKGLPYYLFGNIVLIFAVFGFILLLSIFLIVPIFNIIVLIIGFCIMLYYAAIYMYLPFTAILNHSTKDLFKNTRDSMNEHIGGSFLLIIISRIIIIPIDYIIIYMIQHSTFYNSDTLFIQIGMVVIAELLKLVQWLCLISYITLAHQEGRFYKVQTVMTKEAIKESNV